MAIKNEESCFTPTLKALVTALQVELLSRCTELFCNKYRNSRCASGTAISAATIVGRTHRSSRQILVCAQAMVKITPLDLT